MGFFSHLLIQMIALASAAMVQEPADVEFFEKSVRPILVARCFECHSASEQNGGLRLDSGAALEKGGESGAVVRQGDPNASLLIEAIRYKNQDLQMPPQNRLPESEVAILERWVREGAVFPTSETLEGESKDDGSPRPVGMSIEDGKRFWSMLPISNPPVPSVSFQEWVRNPIDAFVLSKLESAGLPPPVKADRPAWIRRATYDLIGLPPTADEIDAFVADSSADAFDRVIDRLLESPDYGVRWGRHWLDVARYADSNGLDENVAFGNAWRYRDYVVNALNQDMPFDRFLIEQIAGDLVPYANNDTHTATGFLALGAKVLAEPDVEKLMMDTIDEQLDTIGKAFMGITMGCARCHDHKFDPIKQSDYYRLAAIFKSTQTFSGKNFGAIKYWNEHAFATEQETAKIKEVDAEIAKKQASANKFKSDEMEKLRTLAKSKATEYLIAACRVSPMSSLQEIAEAAAPAGLHPRILHHCRKHLEFHRDDPFFSKWTEVASVGDTAGIEAHYRPLFENATKAWQQGLLADPPITKLADASLEDARLVLNDAAGLLAVPAKPSFAFDEVTLREYYRLADDARLLESFSPDASAAMSVRENRTLDGIPIHVRGSHRNLGEVVERGFPEVMSVSTVKPILPKHQSGRLELAQWLASSSHPLTARVAVNRVWGWHFGNAMVRSTENFGRVGDPPSHPELLDWMARWFIESGWSTKQLHRLIMNSKTYQSVSIASPEAIQKDPDNKLLSHFPMLRLDAEQIRDSILEVSDQLDKSLHGKTVPLRNRQFVFDHTSCDNTKYDSLRRTIYLPVIRNNLYSLFEQFDFPDPTMPTGHRNTTTVAPQSLLMMNSDLVLQASDRIASKLLSQSSDPNEQTNFLYRSVLGRLPSDSERSKVAKFLLENNAPVRDEKLTAESWNLKVVWSLICQSLLTSNEFFYLR